MKTTITTILTLATLAAAPVTSQTLAEPEAGLLLAGASYHVGLNRQPDQLHPAVGVQTERWSAGLFENSDGNPSAWAARRWTRGRAFFEAGVAANYDVSPILPTARAGFSFRNAEVFVMPAYGTSSENVGAAIVVQLRLDAPSRVRALMRLDR